MIIKVEDQEGKGIPLTACTLPLDRAHVRSHLSDFKMVSWNEVSLQPQDSYGLISTIRRILKEGNSNDHRIIWSGCNNETASTWRRYFREIYEEKSTDKWIPVIGGIIFFSGLAVSVIDFSILQLWKYQVTFVSVAGFLLLGGGAGLRSVARRTLGRYFSPVIKIHSEQKLVTHGVYRFVRHPIYLSEILSYFAIPMIFGSLYGFTVMVTIIPLVLWRIRNEESVLVSVFGEEYISYARRTKKLIPFLY